MFKNKVISLLLLAISFFSITPLVLAADAPVDVPSEDALSQNSSKNSPINYKLYVKIYDHSNDKHLTLSNGYLFVDTVKKSGNKEKVNQYLKTNIDGYAELTMPGRAAGSEITLYKVSSNNSDILDSCKLAVLDKEFTSNIVVPEAEDNNDQDHEVILYGYDCHID